MTQLIDIHCKGCDKLLAKATIMVAAIKCPRCKMLFEYHVYTNTLHSNSSYGILEIDESMPRNRLQN